MNDLRFQAVLAMPPTGNKLIFWDTFVMPGLDNLAVSRTWDSLEVYSACRDNSLWSLLDVMS